MTTISPATADAPGTAQSPETIDAPRTTDALGAAEARIRTPDFPRALRRRFSAVGFASTGGIRLSGVPAWPQPGAAAFGLGSALVRPDDSLADLAVRVRRLTERVRERGECR